MIRKSTACKQNTIVKTYRIKATRIDFIRLVNISFTIRPYCNKKGHVGIGVVFPICDRLQTINTVLITLDIFMEALVYQDVIMTVNVTSRPK